MSDIDKNSGPLTYTPIQQAHLELVALEHQESLKTNFAVGGATPPETEQIRLARINEGLKARAEIIAKHGVIGEYAGRLITQIEYHEAFAKNARAKLLELQKLCKHEKNSGRVCVDCGVKTSKDSV